jgi:hypothetical protein
MFGFFNLSEFDILCLLNSFGRIVVFDIITDLYIKAIALSNYVTDFFVAISYYPVLILDNRFSY